MRQQDAVCILVETDEKTKSPIMHSTSPDPWTTSYKNASLRNKERADNSVSSKQLIDSSKSISYPSTPFQSQTIFQTGLHILLDL